MSDRGTSTSRRIPPLLVCLVIATVVGTVSIAAEETLRIDSVEPTSAGPGDRLTLRGAHLPAALDGLVLLRDRRGAGTLCSIESSTGDVATCRLDAAASTFTASVEVHRGRWVEPAPRVEAGLVGAWIVEERLFVTDDGAGGGASDPAVQVLAPGDPDGSGGGAWSAVHRPSWLEIDVGPVATGAPGTIGIDFVHQPGNSTGGDGGGTWPGKGTVVQQLSLDLVDTRPGGTPPADPADWTSDLGSILADVTAPFGVQVEAQDSSLLVVPDPWTDGALLVVRVPADDH